MFLSDPGVPGLIFVSRCLPVSGRPFVDFTDVTLADEDGNSKPADYVNRSILGNVAMHVAPPGGQTCNLCK